MSTATDYEAELRRIAEFDWVYAGRYDRLHSPAEATYDVAAWALRDVTMACGWRVETASIPGMFSRMNLPRCSRCGDKVGLPHGDGSPKNDDACRILLGIPCMKIDPAPRDEFANPPMCRLPTGHEGGHEYSRTQDAELDRNRASAPVGE